MRRSICAAAVAIILVATSGVAQEGRLWPSRANAGVEIAYGNDAKQRLSYWRSSNRRAPLMVFIHGGGWSLGSKTAGSGSKPGFYNANGYGFASLDYRLVPNVRPDDQARDIATAIAKLRRDAGRLGVDPNHIVLMGHSAGAHLAALVSSDTRYLDVAGVPVSAIRGTILLDGAGYDVARQMADHRNRILRLYDAAFGKDPAVQRALSPITHVMRPNISRWLILHVADRADSAEQSQALGARLKANGAMVSVKAIPDSTHGSINRDAGTAGTITANAISAFIK